MSERFAAAATKAATIVGNYLTFLAALGLVVVWAVSGPFFGFSATWQLVINTGTTIVTFLMVFLIQNSQNRESIALHLKIDELIRSIESADDTLITAEEVSESELQTMKAEYHKLAKDAAEEVEHALDETEAVSSKDGGVSVDVVRARTRVVETPEKKHSSTSVAIAERRVGHANPPEENDSH